MTHLYIEIEVQEGEFEHSHKILQATNELIWMIY